MIRDAKREYYTNEINNSAGDMSKMWKKNYCLKKGQFKYVSINIKE